ncbi:MAG: mechanosensitive ion channel family protein, partial [Thermomicrobiales bacterium]|nr:mechanosensitive ion channel family protein [Thermomicrobiales bacterium]
MVPAGIYLVDSAVTVLSQVPNEILDGLTTDEVVEQVSGFLGDAGRSLARIALIIVVSLIILRLLRAAVQRVVTGFLTAQGEPTPVLVQRADTLGRVVESTGRVIVIAIAVMMVLTNLGMDIAPLIASAGLAGVAIGLGAQSLVRDMINGFFIIFENQYGVGDVITVGADTGTVETIDLRRTVLRSINGAQIIIPNGEIRVI